MNTGSVPKRGDIVWMTLDPISGHEQGGRRPVLVVTPTHFNQATGLAYVVPITSKRKGYAIEVTIEGKYIQGVVLASALRSIDWRARKTEFADTCPADALRAVQKMIISFVASE